MKTQTTKDYYKFQLADRNRELKMPQIKALKKSMAQFGFIEAFPIIATRKGQKLEITDGQNRFEAARELDIPIYYVISDKVIDPASIPPSKPWTFSDYINRHANQGIPEYEKAMEVAREYCISISTVVHLLSDDLSNNKSGALKEGRLKLTNEVMGLRVIKTATTICEKNKDLLVNPLVRALHKVSKLNTPPFAEVCSRLIQNAGMISRFNNVEVGLQEIEAAYNWKVPFLRRVGIALEVRKIMAERKASFGGTTQNTQ